MWAGTIVSVTVVMSFNIISSIWYGAIWGLPAEVLRQNSIFLSITTVHPSTNIHPTTCKLLKLSFDTSTDLDSCPTKTNFHEDLLTLAMFVNIKPEARGHIGDSLRQTLGYCHVKHVYRSVMISMFQEMWPLPKLRLLISSKHVLSMSHDHNSVINSV